MQQPVYAQIHSTNNKKQIADKAYSMYYEKNTRQLTNCEVCSANFTTILKMKHKCKRCRRIICHNCGPSSQKTFILGIDHEQKKKHRTCILCVEEINQVNQFIVQNQISWGEDSKVGVNWSKKVESILNKSNGLAYNDYLNLKHQPATLQYLKSEIDIIEKDVNLGRTDYLVFNYSLKQFMHLSMQVKGRTNQQCRDNIFNVLLAFCLRNSKIGYCQGMNLIAAFLLIYCEEETAFWLLCALVENIFPPQFFDKSSKGQGVLGLCSVQHAIVKVMRGQEGHSEQEKDILEQFVLMKAPQMLLVAFINTFDFSTQFNIFHNLFTSLKFDYIEIIMLNILSNHKAEILQYGDPRYRSEILNDIICREGDIMSIDQFYAKSCESMAKEIQKFKSEYMVEFKEKWSKQDARVLHQLQKITYFQKNEIIQIQNEFNKVTQDKNGLNRGQFGEIINKICQQSKLKVFESIGKEHVAPLFEMFNFEGSDRLDFREFLICVSFLTRGTLLDKLEMLFNIYDHNSLSYLSTNQFLQLIDSLTKTTLLLSNELHSVEQQRTLSKQVEAYKEQKVVEFESKKYITLFDVLSIEQDEFMQHLKMCFNSLQDCENTPPLMARTKRISTVHQISTSLEQFTTASHVIHNNINNNINNKNNNDDCEIIENNQQNLEQKQKVD